MTSQRRTFLELHFAVFLFGFAAIFGDLISISAVALVWWRTGFTAISFLIFREIYGEIRALDRKHIISFLLIGVIVCVHWICFYGSIKLANASIALVCFSTTSLFTALIAPFFSKTRIHKVDLLFGLAIIPAMALIANSLDYSMIYGFVVGILSSIFASLFTCMNKGLIDVTGPATITILEMLGAFLFLSIFIPYLIIHMEMSFMPVGLDWLYLILLVLFVTTLGFWLNMRALKHVSAFTSSFVVNLEPVYGIILAIVILKDHQELSQQFYLGVIIIGLLVFLYPWVKKKMGVVY